MALLTDSELPQVLKNVCSAPTASAINSWACSRTPFEDCRSSSPGVNLLARFPGLRLAVPAEQLTWRPGVLINGLDALPVNLR